MIKNILYIFRNKKLISKIFVVKNYFILWFFILIIKPISFYRYRKKKIYFFQDRDFGIDNAYFLYKYYIKNHPQITSIYLVKNIKDAEYKDLSGDKNIVYNFSLKHFWYFILSEKIIYSFDTAPFYFFWKIWIILKKILKPKTKLIFLWHWVTRVHIPFFNKENNNFNLFITASKHEKKFLDDNFWYNRETAVTWLPRFDNLYNNTIRKKQIFFFPTWDNKLNWLSDYDFLNTDYFKEITSILNSEKLSDWLNNNDYLMYYYPHQGISRYIHLFTIKNSNIIILQDLNKNKVWISQLILESTILITNYSSIVFDFAYQWKSIIYYDIWKDHYDKKAFYYYFFWEHINTISALIYNLNWIVKNNKLQIEKYKNNTDYFFQNIDWKNCERTSILINNL